MAPIAVAVETLPLKKRPLRKDKDDVKIVVRKVSKLNWSVVVVQQVSELSGWSVTFPDRLQAATVSEIFTNNLCYLSRPDVESAFVRAIAYVEFRMSGLMDAFAVPLMTPSVKSVPQRRLCTPCFEDSSMIHKIYAANLWKEYGMYYGKYYTIRWTRMPINDIQGMVINDMDFWCARCLDRGVATPLFEVVERLRENNDRPLAHKFKIVRRRVAGGQVSHKAFVDGDILKIEKKNCKSRWRQFGNSENN